MSAMPLKPMASADDKNNVPYKTPTSMTHGAALNDDGKMHFLSLPPLITSSVFSDAPLMMPSPPPLLPSLITYQHLATIDDGNVISHNTVSKDNVATLTTPSPVMLPHWPPT